MLYLPSLSVVAMFGFIVFALGMPLEPLSGSELYMGQIGGGMCLVPTAQGSNNPNCCGGCFRDALDRQQAFGCVPKLPNVSIQ